MNFISMKCTHANGPFRIVRDVVLFSCSFRTQVAFHYLIASKLHSEDTAVSSCVVIRNASSFVRVLWSSWVSSFSRHTKSCQWRIVLKSFSVKYTPLNFSCLQWCTLDIVQCVLACTFYQMPLFLPRIWNKNPTPIRTCSRGNSPNGVFCTQWTDFAWNFRPIPSVHRHSAQVNFPRTVTILPAVQS